MSADDQRAFLTELLSVMKRHGVESIYPTYDGDICVAYRGGIDEFYDLGTVEEIEKEMKNL